MGAFGRVLAVAVLVLATHPVHAFQTADASSYGVFNTAADAQLFPAGTSTSYSTPGLGFEIASAPVAGDELAVADQSDNGADARGQDIVAASQVDTSAQAFGPAVTASLMPKSTSMMVLGSGLFALCLVRRRRAGYAAA